MIRRSLSRDKKADDALTLQTMQALLQETTLEMKQAFKEELQNMRAELNRDLAHMSRPIAPSRNPMSRVVRSPHPYLPHRASAMGNFVRHATALHPVRSKDTHHSNTLHSHKMTVFSSAQQAISKVKRVSANAVDTVLPLRAMHTVLLHSNKDSDHEGEQLAEDDPLSREPLLQTSTPVENSPAVSSIGPSSDPAETSLRSASMEGRGKKKHTSAHHKLRDMTFDESSEDEHAEDKSSLRRFIEHAHFHYVVFGFIVFNALLVGLETDHRARHLAQPIPPRLIILNVLICIFFLVEMTLRIVALRCRFFTSKRDAFGNVFDLACVVAQLAETIMPISPFSPDRLVGLLVFMRTLRLLRLFRSHSLVRSSKLRMIIISIWHSLASLFWTLLVIIMVVYVVGIGMTQVATSIKMEISHQHVEGDHDNVEGHENVKGHAGDHELEHFFGTLPRAILSLYEAVSDGIHWHELMIPFREYCNSMILDVLFSLYMAFMLFAMMNVITGHIVEGAFAVAEIDKKKEQLKKMRQMFNAFDVEGTGKITWESFSDHLQHDEATKNFFKDIDLDAYEAISLFSYLDKDHENSIFTEHFVEGCTRFRGPAKVSHIMAFMEAWQEHSDYIESALEMIMTGAHAGEQTGKTPSQPVASEGTEATAKTVAEECKEATSDVA